MTTLKRLTPALFLISLCGPALGGQSIPNWPAPPSWSPARPSRGVTTMGDISSPLPFIAITPCRVADTRGNGFSGQYGPPALVANATRNFTITGQCGIPSGASAVSFNFGALNVGGAGDLRTFPAGGGVPLVSTLNYNAGTPNIANAAVVPIGTAGAITVQADAVSIDLIIDVNGYYSSTFGTPQNYFSIDNNSTLFSIFSNNNSTTCFGACGVLAQVNSTNATGATAIWGDSFGASGAHVGVRGRTFSSSANTSGVYGTVAGTGNNAAGVKGEAIGTSGKVYGVYGKTGSTDVGAAGVLGQALSGMASIVPFPSAGVRGDSFFGQGVLGVSEGYIGVAGDLVNSSGSLLAAGFLGSTVGVAMDTATQPWGVFSAGNFGASGAKHFVEPHPSDPSRVILYSSLEGREVGTYFRARARCVDGAAMIAVPEDFAMVTDENDLSVQATAIGKLASFAVERLDLNEVVLACSQNVEVFVTVNGIRRAFKDFEPVARRTDFAPRSAQERMPLYLTEEAKRRLIANGTYNRDGTANMETAERLGWTKAWADREARARAAAREARTAAGPDPDPR